MKKRGKRSYARSQQVIHQTVIEIETPDIRFPFSLRKDSRPGNGKTVCLDAQVAHQFDVFFVTMVVVTSNIAVLGAFDVSRCMRKGVPDRGRSSVFGNGAFYLIAGG